MHLVQPTRAAKRGTRNCPYLVLLPVGFSLPLPLLEARCALTLSFQLAPLAAPFHPYQPTLLRASARQALGYPKACRAIAALAATADGIFSVALSLRLPPAGVTRHRVPWSPDFPPAFAKATAWQAFCRRLSRRSLGEDGRPSSCLVGEVYTIRGKAARY